MSFAFGRALQQLRDETRRQEEMCVHDPEHREFQPNLHLIGELFDVLIHDLAERRQLPPVYVRRVEMGGSPPPRMGR